MEWAIFGVVGIITIVAAGAFSKKLGVASPILLIVIGIAYSFIPGAPTEVEPEWILMGLLPPILYASALSVPIVDFRRNFASISALSVLLVVVSALITGLVLYWVFPALSLPAAIAVGAVISPTDAVAATALGKRLGLPPRLVTILEGEGLVNDATALVLLRSALAAVATTVSFWSVIGDFLYAAIVAIIVGLLVAYVAVFLRSKLKDPALDTALSFAMPFIAYLPAEELGASGVLAVVAAGLYSGHQAAKRFSAQARINERLNWRTVQFVLENGVFLLMGVELSSILTDVTEEDLSIPHALLLGLLVTGIVIVVRFFFVAPLLMGLRRRRDREEGRLARSRRMLDLFHMRRSADERHVRRLERAEQRYERRATDHEQLQSEGLGWRGGLVLSWAGMRGVVTLAAAQSLPLEGIPYRPQLVLIAFTVAVVTLLLQGGTLPFLIRFSGIRGPDRVADRRELAELLDEMSKAGVDVLENPSFSLVNDRPIDEAVIERVRNDTLLGAESAWERAENGVDEDGIAQSPHQQYRALRREVLEAEREALLEARSAGMYSSRILSRAESMLDLEDSRLAQMDNPSGT
jgi:CPA1 family monovalent cation:H+ antiporter